MLYQARAVGQVHSVHCCRTENSTGTKLSPGTKHLFMVSRGKAGPAFPTFQYKSGTLVSAMRATTQIYTHTECKMCHRQQSWQHFSQEQQITFRDEGFVTMPTCFACLPCDGAYDCTVCKRTLPRSAFYARRTVAYHRRCKECYRCSVCGQTQRDARQLVSDEALCVQCNRRTCDLCKASKV